jgi:hypothetical protein
MRSLVSQHGSYLHSNVLNSLHKLWAEKPQDVVADINGAVVLLIIVGSTIRLLPSEMHTALPHVGQRSPLARRPFDFEVTSVNSGNSRS